MIKQKHLIIINQFCRKSAIKHIKARHFFGNLQAIDGKVIILKLI